MTYKGEKNGFLLGPITYSVTHYFLRACLVLVDQISYAVEEKHTYSHALDPRLHLRYWGRFPLTDLATSGGGDTHESAERKGTNTSSQPDQLNQICQS